MDKVKEYEFHIGSRFVALRGRLSLIPVCYDESIEGVDTDGERLYIGKNPEYTDYVRSLISLLSGHSFAPERVIKDIWLLACNMAAEYIRTYMDEPEDSDLIRRNVRLYLKEETNPCEAAEIYSALIDLHADELDEVRGMFEELRYIRLRGEAFASGAGKKAGEGALIRKDASEIEPDREQRTLLAELRDSVWPELLAKVMSGENGDRRWSLYSGTALERIELREQMGYDFSRYLRRFSVRGEEMKPDQDSFDQIPYCMGLERYGRLPLVEPLEYTDSFKVEDLVIAVDTSGSCSIPVVQRFLSEIKHILLDHDAFFEHMNVHILQCDSYVREHKVIHSKEDFVEYAENITIHGRRGTDFRPVFDFVDSLISAGELDRLKALFYFTDGKGVYPEKAPEYEAAFVYSTSEALKRSVPEWVIPLCLTDE